LKKVENGKVKVLGHAMTGAGFGAVYWEGKYLYQSIIVSNPWAPGSQGLCPVSEGFYDEYAVEVGEKGHELSEQIVDITANFSKIRIVGPNCMGLTRIDGDSDSEEKGGLFTSFLVLSLLQMDFVVIDNMIVWYLNLTFSLIIHKNKFLVP